METHRILNVLHLQGRPDEALDMDPSVAQQNGQNRKEDDAIRANYPIRDGRG
jgi:hypothetical protein